MGLPIALLLCTSSGQLVAQDDYGLSLSANAAIVSDYRFRGISLSDRDFAIQGGFDASHSSGFYVGTWGSSIETFEGSEFELDIYAGYGAEYDGFELDIGVLAYTYPGSSGTAYLEVYGSISGSNDMFGWTVGSAYSWSQENIGDTDNIYIYVDGSIPLGDTPLSLAGRVAFEDGAFGDNKWEWNAGIAYEFEQFSLSVSYIDTNVDGRLGNGAVVGMLSAGF